MLKNFLWQREDEPQNMLTYLFVFVNFCYGLKFTLDSGSPTVDRSPFTSDSAFIRPELWGVFCLLLAVSLLAAVAFRFKRLGQAVGVFGFILWFYGFQIYLTNNMVFPAFAFYFTQMLFWTFWFIGVNRFYKRENSVVHLRDKEDEPGR